MNKLKAKISNKNKNPYDLYISREDIINFPNLAKIDLENKIRDIKNIKTEEKTFFNTIVAYETSTYHWDKIMGLISNYSMCHTDKETRDLSYESEEEYINILNTLFYDKDLYNNIMNYINGNFEDEKEILDSQDIKLVEDIIIGFKKSGFHLAQKSINKILSLDKKINILANKFDKNLVKNVPYILCNKEELSGVPEKVINSFEKVEKQIKSKKGVIKNILYKVSIQHPSYGPFMKYADNREKRQELYKVFMNNGGKENVKILDELVKLRQEKAVLLGFESYAHYQLVDRLAKHPQNVYKLLESLMNKLQKNNKKELTILNKEAKKYFIDKVENYDTNYLINKVLEREYHYDEQKLREYFDLDIQIEKMFELFEKLFNIKVREIDNKEKSKMNIWHKDVRAFEIVEKVKENKILIEKRIAVLFMDLFPRDGKSVSICLSPFVSSHNVPDQEKVIPMSLAVFQLSKPLINLYELECLYHEVGHAMHSLLSKAKYMSHFGTNTSWDFVELPSQMMELWLSDKKYLKSISKHYKTGKSLDNETLNNLINMKKTFNHMRYVKILSQSLFDMDIHTKDINNKVQYYQEILAKYCIMDKPDILFVSTFSHIANAYGAGYYSYIWAEVIMCDVFAEFSKHGLTNKKIGEKYKKEILEKGSSRKEEDSIFAFLGRKYNNKAFLNYINNM